jgi:DNA-binding beta-propeller fold protein YncE
VKRLLALLLAAGCSPADAVSTSVRVFGGPGAVDGKFATPRAAAWDAKRARLYVVDKTARVQRFDLDGRVTKVWSTPAVELGRPTGVAIDPDGNVLVADTHYHRILRYSSDGELLAQFGNEGTGPGQFTYPTGIAVRPDGTVFVSEFGGNDRIQVFTPDGKFLRAWGSYGEEPGCFKRPQAIALAGERLYVADAANHRIQVFDLEGKPLAQWGDLRYPYSVSIDDGGDLIVAEYGRHRVSKWSPDGRFLAAGGRPGAAPGELNTPWGAIAAGPGIFVVDSGNHRVQLWTAGRLTP